MITYDVECPCCGWVNRNLFLEETDGWMECEACKSVSRSERFFGRTGKTVYPHNIRLDHFPVKAALCPARNSSSLITYKI